MKSAVLAFLCLCLATGVAVADYVITVEYRNLEETPPTVEEGRIYLTPDKLKTDMNPSVGGGHTMHSSMIYHGDREAVIILEHDRKMYTELDKQSMEAVSQQLNDAMKQMEEQMAQMPEEQREMMKKFMQDQMPTGQTEAMRRPEYTIERTDRREKIGGHDCVCYEVRVDGAKSNETWVATWDDVDVDAKAFQIFHDMAAFYRGLLESMPGADQRMSDGSFFDGLEEIDGFPVLIREFEGTTVTGETLFKSIEKQKIDPTTFEVPAGYKKQEMFGRG